MNFKAVRNRPLFPLNSNLKNYILATAVKFDNCGQEFENDIIFQPSGIDFAEQYKVVYHIFIIYLWSCHTQENISVIG